MSNDKFNSLIWSIEAKNDQRVEELMGGAEGQLLCLEVSDEGETPLMVAARLRHNAGILALLPWSNVNFLDPNGGTPFIEICKGGDRDAIKLGLEAGGDLALTDSMGISGMARAVRGCVDEAGLRTLQEECDRAGLDLGVDRFAATLEVRRRQAARHEEKMARAMGQDLMVVRVPKMEGMGEMGRFSSLTEQLAHRLAARAAEVRSELKILTVKAVDIPELADIPHRMNSRIAKSSVRSMIKAGFEG